MKLANIEEGEYYLIGSTNPQHEAACQCRVIEIAKMEKPGKYTTSKIRRVRGVVTTGEDEGQERILDAQEVYKPWSDVQEELERAEQERRERRETAERIAQEAQNLRDVLPSKIEAVKQKHIPDLPLEREHHISGRTVSNYSVGFGNDVQVSGDFLLALLDHILDAD